MMVRRLVLLAALAAAPYSLGAQRDTTPRREALAQRFRERFGMVVKERLQLSDSQVAHLGAVNRRFEEQRRLLLEQERDIRMSLRDELIAAQRGAEGTPGSRGEVNQERIGALLDRSVRVQRQRVELLEAEQRELRAFLTPLQRAKLLGLQEQLRRQARDLRPSGRSGRGIGEGSPPAQLRERLRRDSGRVGRPNRADRPGD